MHYVMSDIHGRKDKFDKLMKEINFCHGTDTLYVLGDVIDRGESGIELLKQFMYQDSVKVFLGNHEQMMMFHYLFGLNDWLLEGNGGLPTKQAFESCTKEEQKRLLDFLKTRTHLVKTLTINDTCYQLSHAAFTPVYNIDLETIDTVSTNYDWIELSSFLWGWGEHSVNQIPLLKQEKPMTFIVGHTPTTIIEGWQRNQIYKKKYDNGMTLIDIDCGCAFDDGQLGCLCLETKKEYYG